MLTDSRFITGVLVGAGGLWAIHRFARPLKGKNGN